MLRRSRVVLLAACATACGTFLGLSGDDGEDSPTTTTTSDGSADGRDDEGGTTVPGGDSGDKTDAASATDAAVDAKSDSGVDASDGSAWPFRYVFVTSTETLGSFGADNADGICKTHADGASSVAAIKGKQWRAWISRQLPQQQNAADRIAGNKSVPFRLVNNTLVATNFNDLTDGVLSHAIDRNEQNDEVASQPVWTAANPAGVFINTHCSNWTGVGMGINGKVGSTGSAAGAWSEDQDRSCVASARLYCFEF